MSFEQNNYGELQPIENYLRKGEYPETINGKTEKANFEEDADMVQNFKFENGSYYILPLSPP